MTKLKKINLFATKDSVTEAFEYGLKIANGTNNPAAVTTALYVLYNTMIDEFNKNELNQNS